jgi:hypothetical protein
MRSADDEHCSRSRRDPGDHFHPGSRLKARNKFAASSVPTPVGPRRCRPRCSDNGITCWARCGSRHLIRA